MIDSNSIWQSDDPIQRRKVFKLRLSRLVIGDALVCDDSGWRVDCDEDSTRLGERQFVLIQHQQELVRRKRIDSAVEFLIASNVPSTLAYVPQGASHLVQLSELDDIELLGYLPFYEDPVSPQSCQQKAFRRARIVFRDRQASSFAARAVHEIVRFVIEESQSTWLIPQVT